MRSKTEDEIFRERLLPIAHSIRHTFTHILSDNKGSWRDQIFFHSEGKRLFSITPLRDFKYLDPTQIMSDMMEALQSITVTEAIYTCCRPMELKDGPIDTFNINYIGPACWDGGSICLPYVYSHRVNEAWTFEHKLFDDIADNLNEPILDMLRHHFYTVSNISFTERTRLLTSKGYKVLDSQEVMKNRVATVIATIGRAAI